MSMTLYSYWRSSAAYRVRIALELKGIPYKTVAVNLVGTDGGDHRRPGYLALNPLGRVPTLMLENGEAITQSPAILEYLEERYPTPALLPTDEVARAQVRSLCAVIACDIHPLNNLSALQALRKLGHDETAVRHWVGHWIEKGFTAIESLLPDTGFCHENAPTLADACLIPQIYNARRFKVALAAFPRIARIEQLCLSQEAFKRAAPENQPDAVTPT